MTFQIGAIASDGIILASDTKITQTEGCRSSIESTKINISDDPVAMYCWAGDYRPGEIARHFLEAEKVSNRLGIQNEIRDGLGRAAHNVWTLDYGPKYGVDHVAELKLKHSPGELMIACRGESSVGLWKLNYHGGIDPYPVQAFAASGDAVNSAVFFLNRYYKQDRSQTTEELLPLVSHTLVMAGLMNPTGVGGLEIAVWMNSANKPELLNAQWIARLTRQSGDFDEMIRRMLSLGCSISSRP